jgi:hypothetical protein
MVKIEIRRWMAQNDLACPLTNLMKNWLQLYLRQQKRFAADFPLTIFFNEGQCHVNFV